MSDQATNERAKLERALLLARELRRRHPWKPLPGPQTLAYESKADIIGYGGSAGGGKTDLACGKAITKHKRVLIVRREKAQTEGVVQRLTEIAGSSNGYNSQKGVWRLPVGTEPLIEFGGLDNPGDENRWQGRAHDLKLLEEVAEMRESQARFVMGWTRSADPTVKPQVLMTFNPPTKAEGRWVIAFFAPWLDSKHPNPAKPGELRWFTTIGGKDVEVPDSRSFVLGDDGEYLYDFNPDEHKQENILTPKSRTFIPARVTDNPYLIGTGYMSTLQSLPEPLRSQMLYGDFNAGIEDDPWQVIPTAWVEAAQTRWVKPAQLAPMDSLGVDVARGGKDNTIIARRHGMWFDEPLTYTGAATPDGPSVAGLCIAAMRDAAPIHIDVIGVGASPYDFLNSANQQVVGVNVSEKSLATDKSGRLRFFNQRSEYYWKMREALDPSNNTGICLPPNKQLLADLCAPTWELSGSVIKVESREGIINRIGRSPDWASAYMLALIDTPKRAKLLGGARTNSRMVDYDPYSRK
jgi:hypothetical protein